MEKLPKLRFDIKRQSFPFVLKLQMSYNGITTMICRDEEELKGVCGIAR